jgi:hypothetical protein
MLSKPEIYSACLNQLENKISDLKRTFQEITEEAKTDSKSSAGDKHETSRAMMQMEQEKISRQIENTIEQKNHLEKINNGQSTEKIINGSLILTDHGYFFLSIGMGKIMLNNMPVFVLSPESPLGEKLLGLKRNDSVTMNDKKYLIINFW